MQRIPDATNPKVGIVKKPPATPLDGDLETKVAKE